MQPDRSGLGWGVRFFEEKNHFRVKQKRGIPVKRVEIFVKHWQLGRYPDEQNRHPDHLAGFRERSKSGAWYGLGVRLVLLSGTGDVSCTRRAFRFRYRPRGDAHGSHALADGCDSVDRELPVACRGVGGHPGEQFANFFG